MNVKDGMRAQHCAARAALRLAWPRLVGTETAVGDALATAMFVGRSDEYRGLVARVSQPGTVTLVLGEAGIGKSRLVRQTALGVEHPVFVGEAWAGGTATPYLPWMQIASAAAAVLDPFDARFGSRFGDLTPLFSREAARQRFEGDETSRHLLALGLVDYFRLLTDHVDGPITLLIEDAHRCDPHSVELLARVAGQRLPVSIVVTSRPFGEAGPDVEPELEAFLAQSDVLRLGPLGRIAVVSLLADAGLGEDQLGPAMTASGGVPLLLHSWMAERGQRGSGSGRPGIANRLADVSSAARDVLRYAALIGDQFDCGTLTNATGLSSAACLGALSEVEEVGLIDRRHSGVATFGFHHDTFREAVRDQIDLTERGERHATLLKVFLAARGTAAERDITELADHAAGAAFVGDAQLAVELNIEAAETALTRSAPRVAHHHFQRAIELAELAGSPREARFSAELGSLRSLKATGHVDTRASVVQLLTRCGDDEDLTDVFVRAVLLLPTSSSGMGIAPDIQPEVKTWVARALDRLGAERSGRRARLLIELGLQSRDEGSVVVDALFGEAATLADELDDSRLRTHVYTAHRWVRRTAVEGPAVLRRIDQLRSEIRSGDHEAQLWLSGLRVTMLLRIGEMGAAAREVAQLEQALAPVPPVAAWMLGRSRALLQFTRGEIERSEATALAAYESVVGGHQDEVALEFLQMQLSPILRLQARPDVVAPIVEEMVASRPQFLGYRAALAWVLSDLGRGDDGRPHLAHVFASDLTDGGSIEWLPMVALATAAAAALDEPDWCNIGLRLLAPYRDEWILYGTNIVTEGPVSLRLAGAALCTGDLKAAKSDLALAREAIVRANASAFEPELLHYEALLAAAEGNQDLAVATMSNASGSAERLGLDRLAGMFAAHAFQLIESSEGSETGSRSGQEQAATVVLEGVFSRQGATWRVGLGDERVSVGHVKGLLAIAILLDNPGRELTAQQVAAIIDQNDRGVSTAPDRGQMSVGSTEDVLMDETALAQYRARIVDLEEELDEAHRFNDPERRAAAQQELDALVEHIAVSTGLGGNSRQTTSTAERARVRVTKSIRSAVTRISDVAPVLGQHLSASIRTGTYCSYSPDALTEIDWTR